MSSFLPFEKDVHELESKIQELKHLSSSPDMDIVEELSRLQKKSQGLLKKKYGNLSPWDHVLVARHPERPHALDYIEALIDDFLPLAGDRLHSEDRAIVGGIGRFNGQSVMILGQEKGHDTETRLKHNFGMPGPDGYRKVQRLMNLAMLYNLPIISFIDTAGASPVMDAEARGQSIAIAQTIAVSLALTVPFISIVIGEGGSGGAIAMGTANRVYMLEFSIYSVISPEGCASILWRNREKREEAAAALKLQPKDLLKLGIIDGIIPEPLGAAHRDRPNTFQNVRSTLADALKILSPMSPEKLKAQRRDKYLTAGTVSL